MGLISVGIADPQSEQTLHVVQVLGALAPAPRSVNVTELVAACVQANSTPASLAASRGVEACRLAAAVQRAAPETLVEAVLDVGAKVELSFDAVDFGSFSAEQRWGAFRSFQGAAHVVLRDGWLPVPAFEELCEAVAEYSQLESLALLPGLGFDAPTLAPLARALKRQPALQSFGLNVAALGDTDAEGLAAALERCTALEGIYLDVAEMSGAAAARMVDALCALPRLEEIAVGTACGTLYAALLEAVPRMARLTHLQLDAVLSGEMRERLVASLCRCAQPRLRTIASPGLCIRELLQERTRWHRIMPDYEATVEFIDAFDRIKCWFGPHHYEVVAPLAFLRSLQHQRFSILRRFLGCAGLLGPRDVELRQILGLRSNRRLLELQSVCRRMLQLPPELWARILELYLGGTIQRRAAPQRKRKSCSIDTPQFVKRALRSSGDSPGMSLVEPSGTVQQCLTVYRPNTSVA